MCVIACNRPQHGRILSAMADSVTRLNAALKGRYTIERELGEGGMATVYLADDLKHERKVALKVLKPELAAVVGAERFLAEIKTTANLQHPNILPLFDSGEAEGLVYYVMPFVEGESLQERVDREKQLPVDEAVRVAVDVAEALQAAHEQGIVHRDIKPANILVSRGKPLIADFGIALAVSAAGGGSRLTETGLSVGTPFYMSPEQATGDQVVGTATDIYALGSVLYEMLVGDPPYPGSTAQAVLGKIIAGEPVSATKHRPSVPANVDAAVRRALEKLPADRFTSAQDFATALRDEHFRYGEAAAGLAVAGIGPWKRLSVGLAALASVTTLIAGWALFSSEPTPPQSIERFASPFGNADLPGPSGTNAFNLSPDGSQLVYRGASDGGVGTQLWVRRWNDLDPFPVRGTQGGGQPAVSPDGERLAFNLGGQINVLSFEGGPVITLGPGRSPRWGPDAYIYARGDSGAVRMPATGGPAEQITRLGEREGFHVIGDFLPGGDGALLTVGLPAEASDEIRALDVSTGETRVLVDGDFPSYAESGHLVYMFDDILMAARFDPVAMELRSAPVAIQDGVAAYSISDDGKLFFSSGTTTGLTEFVWMTRSGQATPVDPGWTFDAGGGNTAWSLSPDGARLAFRAEADDNLDIWIKDLDDGPLARLTFDVGEDWSPHWSPNGEMVTFVSNRAGGGDNRDVWTKRADGVGEAELLYDHDGLVVEGFWGPDGEWLVLRGGAASAQVNTRDILALRPGVDSVAQPLLAQDYDEQVPALSPDGRWLAYISNEAGSGGFEVFVRPFPDMNAGRWQVSTDGGIMPVWAHNGRELFFLDNNGGLVAAQVDADQGFRVGEKETLFTISGDYWGSTTNTLYGVAPDDQRFLMARNYQGGSQESTGPRFILVNNFFEELRERVRE